MDHVPSHALGFLHVAYVYLKLFFSIMNQMIGGTTTDQGRSMTKTWFWTLEFAVCVFSSA